MQMLTVDLPVVRIIGKALTVPKHKDIILNSWAQTWKNGTPYFLVRLTFEWYEDATVFCMFFFIYLFFLFRTSKKEHIDENEFCNGYGNYCFFKSYLISVMFWVLSQPLWGTLTTTFERHLRIGDFMEMDQSLQSQNTLIMFARTQTVWFMLHTYTKHPFKELEISCTKTKYTAIITFSI